jgi:Tfp pilus assembly protein FimT
MLLVIAIVAVLATATTPFLSTFLVRNNWHVTTSRVVSEITKAQNYAMSGKVISGSTVWGVCITGSTFRMFNGSCASPNMKEDFAFPGGVTINGITSVTFDNLRGEPSPVATINVVSTVGSSAISINAAGMVE